jgi:gluconolactonase
MRTNNKTLLYLIFVAFLSANIYDQAQSQVIKYPKVEKIAEGFSFIEGPLWIDGVGLIFSDIPENKVYLFSTDSVLSVYLDPSGNSNGLTLDHEKRLLLAQHGNRQLARLEGDHSFTSLATLYDGRRLNSPNDLVVKSDGSVFFTDPPYGISGDQEELGFSGIYRLNPAGRLELLDKSLARPNGIVFSPDEKTLYVNDSETRKIYKWDVLNDSTIANKQLFGLMTPAGNADGMKVDKEGFLYVTGPVGVWIFDPKGTPVDTIPVPGQTTNCGWGDKDGKTLYVTSGSALFRIRDKNLPKKH